MKKLMKASARTLLSAWVLVSVAAGMAEAVTGEVFLLGARATNDTSALSYADGVINTIAIHQRLTCPNLTVGALAAQLKVRASQQPNADMIIITTKTLAELGCTVKP